MNMRTRCARGVGVVRDVGNGLALPVVTASTFRFESQAAVDAHYERGEGWIYSRTANPTVVAVERFVADLEEAESAALFASGMGAVSTAVLAHVRAGDAITVQREIYGGSHRLFREVLPAAGVRVDWIGADGIAGLDPRDLEGRKLLYLETPTNPTLRVVDVAAAAEVAHAAGVLVFVDGTFATPVFQRLLSLGADLVLHSGTKYLAGHSDVVAGAVAGRREIVEPILARRETTGAVLEPFSAFLLQRGMRTLVVRLEAQERSACAVARMLAGDSRVRRVHWPGLPDHPDHDIARRQMTGFGAMVSVDLAGGAGAATRVHDGLEVFQRAGSLGGIESLVSMPAAMSHRGMGADERERAGVTPGLLRLSIGLESAEDLIADLSRALDRASSLA